MSRPRTYPEELLKRGVRLALESQRPIAYLRCWEGLVFFAFVLDACSRMIVG